MSKNHPTSVNPGKTATQSQRIFATLVLTSMLSFAASVTLLQAAYAAPRQISQSAASEIVNGKPSDNSLPPRIANAVRQDLSRKVGIAPGKLRIIESSSQTWSDSCLGLGGPAELCAQALVPGWRVVLSNGNQTWVYRTDTQGRAVRLENQTASTNLPKSVADSVTQAASEQLGVSVSGLRIVQAEQKTWANPCIFNFGEVCTREYKPITGWEVTVASRQQRLVYRTDQSGSQVKLDKQASQISDAKLSESFTKAVLQQVSEQSGLPLSDLRIVKAEQKKWPDQCLGISSPLLLCGPAYRDGIPGWLVTVDAGQQRLVYRTNENASSVKLDGVASLPSSVAKAVLQDASRVSRSPISALRIVQAEKQTWDGCLGISKPGVACTEIGILGWQVTVTDGKQLWVYHTDSSSRVVLNEGASRISDADTLKASKIAQSELPPPLSEGVIFRAIASGGFTGQTFQTTLMNDGRVMRVAISPNNAQSSPTVIRQISRQQMQQFQQLLRQNFSRFHQLSYRAPNGSADFISITLTSPDGTTKYADMVQDSLPKALQQVIQAWNQIAKS